MKCKKSITTHRILFYPPKCVIRTLGFEIVSCRSGKKKTPESPSYPIRYITLNRSIWERESQKREMLQVVPLPMKSAARVCFPVNCSVFPTRGFMLYFIR